MPDTYSQANFAINNLTGQTTPRTWKDRLSRVLDVKDFGAVGDGSHDDAPNIQAAVNAAIDSGGGTVYFPVPSSSYRVNSSIVFTHNAANQAFNLIKLQGEKGILGSNNQGSFIQGNVNGYIFDNNNIVVMTVSSVSAPGFSLGETISDNPLSQGTSTPLIQVNVSGGAGNIQCLTGGTLFTGLPINIKGNTSGTTAVMTAQVFPVWVLAHVDGLVIVNSNTTAIVQTPKSAGSGCLRMEGVQTSTVENCYLRGMCALWQQDSSYCSTIRDSYVAQSGNPAGSIGVVGTWNIHNCNFIGLDTAIQSASSKGVTIIGCRFEVNKTGIVLGKDGYGNVTKCQSGLVSGNQFEQTDTCIDVVLASGFAITGNFLSGNVNAAGSGARLYNIRIRSASSALVAANISTGTYSQYGIGVDSGGTGLSQIVICGNISGNAGAGTPYQFFFHSLNDIQVFCNDNTAQSAAMLFASLPASPAVGRRCEITDADVNFNSFTHVAASGGAVTQYAVVYWDGTNWRYG